MENVLVQKESRSVALKKEDALNQERWRDCWQSGVNPATPVYGDKTGSKLD